MPQVSTPPETQGSTLVENENVSSQGECHQGQGSGIPSFSFRKPSTNEEFSRDGEEGVCLMRRGDGDSGGKGFCLNVYSLDVCRICQCGPNTLATPTPLLLTPITSPKKRFTSDSPTPQQPTSSNLTSVTIELKRSIASPDSSPPQLQSPTHTEKTPATRPQLSPDYNLISPCVCSGSLKYVHQCCLQNWIRASNNTACELCKHPFQLRSKFKPLWKWESLPMVPGEKKRIVCSAMFHTVALACVVWSLYVLIDRTIEELNQSDLEWQFWTKIIVEAIGCLGAGILTYVWGKSYISLLIRWISFNRSFVIMGKECAQTESAPPQIVVDGVPTTSHNQDSAREQELINLIN